jgi:hypothetical protein
MESHDGMMLTGVTEELGEEAVNSATLFTTNSTWTDPGANSGLRGEIPATNPLSYGTAILTYLIV